jgi:hypothetical protein
MNDTTFPKQPRKKDNGTILDRHIVRAHLALRRTNLSRWAKDHGFSRFSAHLAINQNRQSQKAKLIVKTLRRELGI